MINKQQLGNTLWGMADILRGKVEDYKAYILTLLFFKRLSDNYSWEIENTIKEKEKEFGRKLNQKQIDSIKVKAHDFIIPEKCFWEDVKNVPMDDKNETLDNSLTSIAEANKSLKGIINAVRWNEPAPDGSGGKRLSSEVLTSLINYLSPVPLDNNNVSLDVLGDAYEYLIKRFADENKSGTTAGQFYTPPEIAEIIVRTIKPQKSEWIHDPTCGSMGLLIKSAKYVKENTGNIKDVRLFGQESVWNTWAIAKMNAMLHGLDADVRQGDTIKTPKFLDGSDLTQFDIVVANFPFSQENWWLNGKPKTDKKGKVETKSDGTPKLVYPSKDEFADPYNRFVYGIPDFSNGDFAFLQHIIASLNDKGRAGVVCPQGVLFRGQPEKTEEEDGQNRKADTDYLIRRGFLEGIGEEKKNIIEAIVVLPANLFYGTQIPGSIIFFNKNKSEERKDKVLMVYAAREGWYKENSNQNELLPHDVMRLIVQLEAWGDINIAKQVIPKHQERLIGWVDEDLDYKIVEIKNKYSHEEKQKSETEEKLKVNELSASEKKTLTKRLARLTELMNKRDTEIKEAEEQAESERQAIRDVSKELIEMFSNPELRKRYFSIVDMDEIIENEYNLNMPRYVDTFEPEEEIDLKEAIKSYSDTLQNEIQSSDNLINFLKLINNEL